MSEKRMRRVRIPVKKLALIQDNLQQLGITCFTDYMSNPPREDEFTIAQDKENEIKLVVIRKLGTRPNLEKDGNHGN